MPSKKKKGTAGKIVAGYTFLEKVINLQTVPGGRTVA